MQCRHEWSLVFFTNTFSKRFTVVVYRKNRQEKAVEREKGLLAEAMVHIEERDRNRRNDAEVSGLKSQCREIRKQMKDSNNKMELRMKEGLLYYQIQEIKRRQEERDKGREVYSTTYTFRCPVGSCRGMIEGKTWKCIVCENKLCNKCHIPLIRVGGDTSSKYGSHTCKKEDVVNANIIKNDTKPCPGCASRVYKINGCDQMFCTQCRASFSWLTGRKTQGPIHNPHYYQLQKKLGIISDPGSGGVSNEIECGGITSYNTIWQTTNGVDIELEHELELIHRLLGESTRLFNIG
jgi:hypothetical protein